MNKCFCKNRNSNRNNKNKALRIIAEGFAELLNVTGLKRAHRPHVVYNALIAVALEAIAKKLSPCKWAEELCRTPVVSISKTANHIFLCV